MGLRDRYLSALVARCAVAGPRECNTQQAASLLHVAPPRECNTQQPAPGLAEPAAVMPLHATRHATATQHTQHDDHETKVQRSAIISADGVPYWDSDDMAGLPAWTNAEIVTFEKRVARSTWLGYGNAKGHAETLLHRDRGADDRRLCVECSHAGPAWRCAKREAFFLDKLQRCPKFKEKAP